MTVTAAVPVDPAAPATPVEAFTHVVDVVARWLCGQRHGGQLAQCGTCRRDAVGLAGELVGPLRRAVQVMSAGRPEPACVICGDQGAVMATINYGAHRGRRAAVHCPAGCPGPVLNVFDPVSS